MTARPLARLIRGQYVAPDEGSITVRPFDRDELAAARRIGHQLTAIEGGASAAAAAIQARAPWREGEPDDEDEGPHCRRSLDVGENWHVVVDGHRRTLAVPSKRVPRVVQDLAARSSKPRAQPPRPRPWWVVELDHEGNVRRVEGPFPVPAMPLEKLALVRAQLLDAARQRDPDGLYTVVASETRPGATR